ncbi:MAG: T9SS type A sorting domain-containing protein, partial [Ignavibacteriales bacterium]|nr:T9SS type A sorting domain-containing protein [Ignavibacteriales bacterium]
NQAPVVNAGIDQTITLPTNSVTLSGTVTDDGLPNPPGTTTNTWTQISRPAGVTFGNANSLTSTATFPSSGTFNLMLTANDGSLSKTDTVKITVRQNQPPLVNAGPDNAISPPTNSVTLNGIASDDGLPNPPGTLTNSWTQSSGPLSVTFQNANALSTIATFPKSGTYKLVLSSNDGQFTSTDTIVINITKPPVVDAGLNQQITLPVDSVLLTATAVDDTLPNPPGKLVFAWTKINGPGLITFNHSDSLKTKATFSLAGTYKIRFAASDGIFQSTDSLIVVVKSAPTIPASLKTVSIPGPDKVLGFDLTQFIVNNDAAIKLGKALYWDMQVGSDGVQACASCHFNAGADTRSKNQVHPGVSGTFGFGKAPNYQLSMNDFPFSKNRTDDDIVGSQGIFKTQFTDISVGSDVESGTLQADNTFNVSGVNLRRVTGRNAPSVINAVYTYRNFWDGRANPVFNGVTPFGPRDQSAKVLKIIGGTVTPVTIAVPLSSLASQTVGPPLNETEMSFNGKTFAKLGKKLLALKPLAKQLVSLSDSRLGTLSRNPLPGLDTSISYSSLIKTAFNSQWWNSNNVITFVNGQPVISGPKGSPLTTNEFTLMEANFSMFWGLAIQAYEQTLVSNDSKFDKFREGTATLTAQEQQGLNLFMGKGKCITCHSGPEFTNASVSAFNQKGPIDRMIMKNGDPAIYDLGFYNIAVRATNEDLGIGADILNFPLSFSKQLVNGTVIDSIPFNANNFQIAGAIQPGERIAVNGAFKVPSLRNVELTGPYFHSGSKATLKEEAIFYNAGGLFRNANENLNDMPPDITVLNLASSEEDAIVAFLLTLTDERVRNQSAPFDHPQIFLPNGHPGDQFSVTNDGSGKATDNLVEFAAVGSSGGTPISPFLNGNPFLAKAGAELEINKEKDVEQPKEFSLQQNFPNPFNPNTKIRYSLPSNSSVKLIIYNMLGQEVRVLVNEIQESGSYEINWVPDGIASGIYIYRLEARANGGTSNFISSKKMIYLK